MRTNRLTPTRNGRVVVRPPRRRPPRNMSATKEKGGPAEGRPIPNCVVIRGDLWRQSDFYCEVWTESRSIAGVVEDDCRELAVSLYPAGGFSSLTLAYQSAET